MFGVGRIVLHASSLLASPPAVRCAYGGMCRLRTTGRKRVLTASNNHSQLFCLFVCLHVCYCIRRPSLGGFKAASKKHLFYEFRTLKQPCQSTWWLTIAALNQYFPPSHTGLFHWQEFKMDKRSLRRGGGMLEWIDGRHPLHSFNSPQSETDFQQLVWTNLQVYWLKT